VVGTDGSRQLRQAELGVQFVGHDDVIAGRTGQEVHLPPVHDLASHHSGDIDHLSGPAKWDVRRGVGAPAVLHCLFLSLTEALDSLRIVFLPLASRLESPVGLRQDVIAQSVRFRQ
jgi:hypothetical protein